MNGQYDERTILHHQKLKADHLILRAKLGLRSDKFRDVNYDELLALTREKKARANASYMAMKRISQTAKKTKESNLMNQHKRVWQQEFLRLNTSYKRLRNHLDHFIDNPADEAMDHVLLDLYEYNGWLDDQLNVFQADTVKPVWDLREDICYWNYRYAHEANSSALSHPDDIRATIDSVTNQQTEILTLLGQEQKVLEQELERTVDDLDLGEREEIQHGIPEEALDLECPSDELKANILQEFLVLDQKFATRLVNLEEEHRQYIESPGGGWCEEDHVLYQYISDQYTSDVPNRGTLCMDLLKRHLPKYSTQQFFEHDTWVTFYKHYQSRRKAVITDWSRDRTELLNRAKVVFKEAWESKWRNADLAESRRHQEELCHDLYEKVLEWRRHKEELKQLELEEEEERQSESLEQQRVLEAKEKQRRDQIKKKLDEHRDQRAERERKKASRRKKRMVELRKKMDDQAGRDRERIAFRESQYSHKRELRALKEEELLRAEVEKEKRLEDLRKMCRVEAESDFERLIGDTESRKLRREGEELVNIQQPLYKPTGFTAQQITSDPRIRVELALREAGLIDRQYARQKLASIQPPTQPRPDTFSTVFKHINSQQ